MKVPARTGIEVETGVPGGNARLCAREDRRVLLAPETRDSTREWFYWDAAVAAALSEWAERK